MKQSLPGIATIHTVECASLMPNMMLRAQCNLPNAVFTDAVQVDLIGTPTLKNETKYNNGEGKAFSCCKNYEDDRISGLGRFCFQGRNILSCAENPYPY